MRAHVELGYLGLIGVLAACGGSEPEGAAIYRQPLAGGNTFACATCHALHEPAPDGIRRPAHPIGDATHRASYKNGRFNDMLDAVNSCLTEWMAAAPWTAEDADWLALHDYLDQQAPSGPAPDLTFQIVDPPADLDGGNASAGRELFNSSCVACHGTDAAGTERAPPLIGSHLDAPYIAERVRHSGAEDSSTYPGLTGGRMPFWSADRLSDAELRDLIAFVLSNDPTPTGPDAGSGDDGGQSCGATHPRVGQTADLVTRYHGVTGRATIVDDCSIRIDMFSYDGTGIDVRIYSGVDGDFGDGFAMTDDLLKSGGYSNDTITAHLPDGKTLDDLDSISVWCVSVGISFGEAHFPSP